MTKVGFHLSRAQSTGFISGRFGACAVGDIEGSIGRSGSDTSR